MIKRAIVFIIVAIPFLIISTEVERAIIHALLFGTYSYLCMMAHFFIKMSEDE